MEETFNDHKSATDVFLEYTVYVEKLINELEVTASDYVGWWVKELRFRLRRFVAFSILTYNEENLDSYNKRLDALIDTIKRVLALMHSGVFNVAE